MANIVEPGDKQAIIDHLNDLSCSIRDFHKFVHQKNPSTFDPVDLQAEEASFYWSAALAETLAMNASNFRSALKNNDGIDEHLIWPDPGPEPGDDPNNLANTIEMSIRMEVGLFRTMMSFYPIKENLPHHPCRTLHDILNELALNQNEFIESENEKDFKDSPIQYADPPSPPDDSEDYPPLESLHRLQLALCRFLQAHMQLAIFIPAHLRLARERALLAREKAAEGREFTDVGPLKFDPRKPHPPHPHGGAGS